MGTSRFVNAECNALGVVESHARSTAVACHFAACFNAAIASSLGSAAPRLFFVPCYMYTAADDQTLPVDEPCCFTGERFLPGPFLKYNSNNGFVGDASVEHHDVVQAFLHYTFAASGGELLVADLQGVALRSEILLTDPQVLSINQAYGPGDLGKRGVRACLSAHRCGATCKHLGLKPVGATQLRRLCPPAQRIAKGTNSSEEGAWDELGNRNLLEYAMSEGGSSNQTSASSWVHVLDS